MTVLVFGASSQIGHFLLPRLLADGEQVLALSRQPRKPQPDLFWLRGQLPADVPALPPLSAIISFGPLQAFADWVARTPLAHAPRVVATSSMSAESKRDSSVPAERELSRQLRAGEVALADACARQDCAWTVLRPTLIYGAGLDKSLTPIARRALRLRVFPLPVARGLRQPVHADDLAQAVLAALDCQAAVRDSLQHTTLPVPLPAWLLRSARHVSPRWRGPLTRLDTDLIADNEEMQRLLGIHPRGFAPDAATWSPVI